jgi:hypothetical protein
MKLKTFTTHTFALIKTIQAIELEFNVWASDNPNFEIVRTDYSIGQRINGNGQKYEEIILFVFYNPTHSPQRR